MIKAIILDVDGVIVGQKKGFNFPLPHPEVMARLRQVRQSGIPISLCTAKPHYAVKQIIDGAGLDNLHITMAGGIITDPIDNVILQKHLIPTNQAQAVVKTYLDNQAYVEVYSVDGYSLQADQVNDLTEQHTQILQQKPQLVDSIVQATSQMEVVKVMPIARNEADQQRLSKLFEPFADDLVLSWGVHPFADPHKFGNVTAKGISKKQAVSELAGSLHIEPSEILGVGDSLADWQFMELCGYAAAMGNASDDLKQLALTKGEQGYVGQTVDDNGLLDIFDHFTEALAIHK